LRSLVKLREESQQGVAVAARLCGPATDPYNGNHLNMRNGLLSSKPSKESFTTCENVRSYPRWNWLRPGSFICAMARFTGAAELHGC
jgi:hypothetical protein